MLNSSNNLCKINSSVWGRVVPKPMIMKASTVYNHRSSFSVAYDMHNPSFAIGRDPFSDWEISNDEVNEKFVDRISKTHCRIFKDCSDIGNPVFIEDKSRNGTFVNGELIGLNEKRILKSNDVISFNEPMCEVFEFINYSYEQFDLPENILKTYHIGRLLGAGAQGKVHLVIDRITCEQFAMKIIRKSRYAANKNNLCDDRIMREVRIMKELLHSSIVRCTNVFIHDNSVFMFLDFMEGGDLRQRIYGRPMSVATTLFFFRQMCSAVKYLHDQNITHRDIKPDNMLLECDAELTTLKLCDFGLSKLLLDDSQLQTLCGTPSYTAPEITHIHFFRTYTNKVDIWSLGVVLYEMLSGVLPFDFIDDTNMGLYERYEFDFRHSRFFCVPEPVKHLIRMMLTVDPDYRPTIDDVLMYPWVKGEDMLREPPLKKRRYE